MISTPQEALEAAARVADDHLSRVSPHCPDNEQADLVAQGYGNAARNIAAAIRALPAHVQPAPVAVDVRKASVDGWQSWLDDLPLSGDFRPSIDALQEFLRDQAKPAPVAEVQAEAVAGAVAQMREALRKLGVIPGKVWMMLDEIDSDAAQEALDRIRAEAREKALQEAAQAVKYMTLDDVGKLESDPIGVWVQIMRTAQGLVLALIKEPAHD